MPPGRPWAKPLSDEEIDAIFKNSIITFDANVLLDIYRVDKKTRQEIKESIEQFKINLWISHQAASEFLKNKNRVEVNSKNIFSKYITSLKSIHDKIITEISKIQSQNHTSNKSIQEKINEYTSSIKNKTEQITTDLENISTTYRDELNDEKTLEWIFSVFEGKVGEPFLSDTLESLHAEADDRIARKIPPGYKDADKDGLDKYGDFLLWKQLLNRAKQEKKPVVFITSEKKEDWFEKISGQIIQPRRELLEESMRETSQRFLIFRTEFFLRQSARMRSGGEISENTEKAIEEIENLGARDDEIEVVGLLNELALNCPPEFDMEKHSDSMQQYEGIFQNIPSAKDIEYYKKYMQDRNKNQPYTPSVEDIEYYKKYMQDHNKNQPYTPSAEDINSLNRSIQEASKIFQTSEVIKLLEEYKKSTKS